MKSKSILFYLIVFIAGTINIKAQVKETNTDWNNIKNSDGKINLTPVKIWGGDVNNTSEVFNNPTDVCIDKEGNYYIVDSGQNKIFVFDKNGKIKRKIGESGKGPWDLSYPSSIKIDNNNNIVVAESGNDRVQVLLKDKKSKMINPSNVYFSNMELDKNNRIILTRGYSDDGNAKLYIFDYNEKQIGSIGAMTKPKGEYGMPHYTERQYDFCSDKEGNIYLAYRYGAPLIEKYSQDGKLLMKINFKLNALPKEPERSRGGKPEEIPAGTHAMAVDDNGNIYVLAQKKDLYNEDIKYLSFTTASVSMGSGGEKGAMHMRKEPPEKQKSKHDFHQLIMFDKYGNLKGSKSLDYLGGRMRIYNGNLFILDSIDSTIHQYKITN